MKTVSFVIPVYNEETRLEKTFNALVAFAAPGGVMLEEVIFVNDGSMDTTKDLIKQFAQVTKRKLPVRLLTYSKNRGKGYAVRKGMLASHSDYTLFFDADMSTPLSELKKFVQYMQDDVEVIIGTRKNGKSTVLKHQPVYRELLGRGFTKLTQLMLGMKVSDFTCGFKAFSRIASQAIFTAAVVNDWAYDAEILFLTKKMHFSLQEKAVLWTNDERTKVKLYKAIPQTVWSLLKIRVMYDMNLAYTTVAKALHFSVN